MNKQIERSPLPRFILLGLRNIGYNFSSALSDVIDNSITAQATKIDIISECFDKEKAFLEIIDDGSGMSEDELICAMELGSERERDFSNKKELGRFGLGLKTASISQCKILTVITKKDNKIIAARWDLNVLEKENVWNLIFLDDDEINSIPNIERLKSSKSGTIVLWQDFDVLKRTAYNFEKSFAKRFAEAKNYCGLVFHRFYDSVIINFNFSRIPKRDPFLAGSQHMNPGPKQQIPFEGSVIEARAYCVPLKKALTQEELSLLGGENALSNEEGFYIYRNDRLIVWGSWFGMHRKEALSKLARVKVDIPATLDSTWGLDVKKSKAVVPDALRSKIIACVEDAVGESRTKMSYEGKKEYTGKCKKYWERTLTDNNEIIYSINRDNPLITFLKDDLTVQQRKVFNELLRDLENFLPKQSINLDISNGLMIQPANRETVNGKIQGLIELILSMNIQDESTTANILDTLLQMENYADLKDYRKEILNKVL